MRIFRDYHDYLISLQNNYDNKTNELLSAIYRRTPIEDALKNWKDALKNRNNELEEKLKSYTNPTRNKKYYEKNSDIVKEKAKNYMEKIKETNPEKLKEWRHQAYLNRKAKLKATQEINENIN